MASGRGCSLIVGLENFSRYSQDIPDVPREDMPCYAQNLVHID